MTMTMTKLTMAGWAHELFGMDLNYAMDLEDEIERQALALIGIALENSMTLW